MCALIGRGLRAQRPLNFGTGYLEGGMELRGFLVRLDPSGTARWSKSLGLLDTSFISKVAIDTLGNIVVGGQLRGNTARLDFGGGALASAGGMDVVLAKLSPEGGHLWSRRFGETADQTLDAVAIDLQGHVLLAGTFWDRIDFGGDPLTSAGGSDIFIARLDARGQHVWSRRYGGPGDDRTSALVADAACGLILAGAGSFELGTPVDGPFVARLDLSGEPVWSRALPAPGPVTADAAGHVLTLWNESRDPPKEPPKHPDFWPHFRLVTHLQRLTPLGRPVIG